MFKVTLLGVSEQRFSKIWSSKPVLPITQVGVLTSLEYVNVNLSTDKSDKNLLKLAIYTKRNVNY